MLRRAEVRVTPDRETRVPGMQTRLAEVTHLGDRRPTRPGSNRTLLRGHNSNSNINNSNNNSNNNSHNNSSSSISSSTSNNKR